MIGTLGRAPFGVGMLYSTNVVLFVSAMGTLLVSVAELAVAGGFFVFICLQFEEMREFLG